MICVNELLSNSPLCEAIKWANNTGTKLLYWATFPPEPIPSHTKAIFCNSPDCILCLIASLTENTVIGCPLSPVILDCASKLSISESWRGSVKLSFKSNESSCLSLPPLFVSPANV